MARALPWTLIWRICTIKLQCHVLWLRRCKTLSEPRTRCETTTFQIYVGIGYGSDDMFSVLQLAADLLWHVAITWTRIVDSRLGSQEESS